MHSALPADILWAILEHMEDDKPRIATLCRVSRGFREVAEPALYRRIALPFPTITPICRALAAQPRLALHVRHFEASKHAGWKPRDATHLVYMRDALRRMRQLRTLRIHFSGPLAWILENCHFPELDFMLCNLSCDHHLASFFRRHTELRDVSLSSLHNNHFPCSIDQACLPSLQRISADPAWLELLVPNHPITDIDVWDFRDSLAATLGLSWSIDWLSSSMTTIVTLSISESFLTPSGARRIAALVPQLRHLKIKCNIISDLFPDEVSEKLQILSRSLHYFKSLNLGEVILRGQLSPFDIGEPLMRHFLADALETMLKLHEFVFTFSPKEPSADTKIVWRRNNEEWDKTSSSS